MNGYVALARGARRFQVVGADALTDRATVERVQRAIVALPLSKQLPEFQPMIQALAVQKGGYGTFGPTTKKAVASFNRAYGWPDDGDKITAGTLEALGRADLKPGYADPKDVADKAAAVASANDAAAKAQAAADAAKALASQSPDAAAAATAASRAADATKAAAAAVASASSATEAKAALSVALDATKDAAVAASGAAAVVPSHPAANTARRAADDAHMAAARKSGVDAMSTLFLAGALGGLLGGAAGAWLWPAHRILGFLLGSLFVGSPVGYGVGMAAAVKKVA